MCLNPFRGFKNEIGRIVCFAQRDVIAVHYDGETGKDGYKKFTSEPFPGYFKQLHCLTDYVDLPCRSCPECYEQTRREWITRAVCESKMHDKMIFLTLTYSDDKIPISEFVDEDGVIWKHSTLRYKDFQNFMKRLRKSLDRPIRFMVCGEYGSHTFRPHYHAIIYGVGLDDFGGIAEYSVNSHGDTLYTCGELERIWKNGYVICSPANIATIGYVAGYVAKKSDNYKGKSFYKTANIVPPFIRSSNRPGLGGAYIDLHFNDYNSAYDYRSVSTVDEPFKVYLTSNWKRKYEERKIYAPMLKKGLIFSVNYDKIVEDGALTDYYKDKLRRRVELFDGRFNLLATDMERSDYNSSLLNVFRNSLKRKRGVY